LCRFVPLLRPIAWWEHSDNSHRRSGAYHQSFSLFLILKRNKEEQVRSVSGAAVSRVPLVGTEWAKAEHGNSLPTAPRPPQPRQRVGIDRGERYRQTQPAPPAGRAGDDNSVVWIKAANEGE